MNRKYKLGFIGCGNMAKAIINGIIQSKIISIDEMIVSTPSISAPYKGIAYTNDNSYVMSSCENVVLAVKPQVFREIASKLDGKDCNAIISIMAGVSMSTIIDACNCDRVFRIMPNTPCAIGEGVSAITSLNSDKDTSDFVESVFSTVSKVVKVDEKYFDAVTSISGSGPAYVYYFIKSMIEGGMKGGLDFNQSKELAIATMIGASKMVDKSDENIDVLIDKVCSKGGTTIQAIDTFKRKQILEGIVEGIENCRKRSEELSKA